MSAEVEGGKIVYDVKDILEGINDKLARAQANHDVIERRLSVVEQRQAEHDRVLNTELPKLRKVIEDLNVQKQVEDALDAKKVAGVSSRDRIVLGALSAAILAIGLLNYLPHVIGG